MTFETMFMLQQRSFKHGGPALAQTFKQLGRLMEKSKTHEHVPGRTAKYAMPNVLNVGLEKLVSAEEPVDADEDTFVEAADGEDGDLDV